MPAQFNVTSADHDLIVALAERAVKIASRCGDTYPKIDIIMDLTACHANGTLLDLAGLLEADDFNFAHDVWGIGDHIDRVSGKLTRCFVPRYASRS